MLGLKSDRIAGQGVLLHGVDVGGHTLRHCVNQRDTDNAYRACKGREGCSAFFGEQVFMDKDDNITGYEERLLISPCAMSMNYLFDVVKSVGGIYIPAHVDRHSYSVLTNLGFIPDDIDIKNIEISRMTEDVDAFLSSREELKIYNIYRNSDAHYLQDMREAEAVLNVSDVLELFGG